MIEAPIGDGRSLPVIDITDPAFALPDDAAARDALQRDFDALARSQARQPMLLRWLTLQFAAWQSPLVAALVRPGGSFLGGLDTYCMKLGPANLPDWLDGEIGRRFAAAAATTAMRVRLQQMAMLLAQDIAPAAASRPAAAAGLDRRRPGDRGAERADPVAARRLGPRWPGRGGIARRRYPGPGVRRRCRRGAVRRRGAAGRARYRLPPGAL